MKRCFAIPVENGALCAHFGHCQKFVFVEVENNEIKDVKELTPPDHVPGLYPAWVAGFNVSDVIAGGMGQRAIELFNQQNINVFAGAPMKPAKELVADFLQGRLTLVENYCDSDHHHHHEGQCRH